MLGMAVMFTVAAVGLRGRVMVVAVALMGRDGHESANVNRRNRPLCVVRGLTGGFGAEVQPFLLLRHQLCVETASGDKLRVSAGFHQPPFVQHKNAVGIDHARQAVSYTQGGPAFDEPVQGLHYYGFVLSIHAGQRFIQYQDRGVLQQSAGDGDALLLAAGQPHGPLAHHCFVALRQVVDELMGIGGPGCLFQLRLTGIRIAETKVVGDRAMEQVGVLRYHRHLFPQFFQGNFAHVPAAQLDYAFPGIEEAQHQPHDGGLARSAGPDQPQGFPLVQREGKIVKRRAAPFVVGVADVLEGNFGFMFILSLSMGRGRGSAVHAGAFWVFHSHRRVHDGENAFSRGHGHNAVVV